MFVLTSKYIPNDIITVINDFAWFFIVENYFKHEILKHMETDVAETSDYTHFER